MPQQYAQFIHRQTGESVHLGRLDSEIAFALNVPADKIERCHDWYGTIAHEVANGRSFAAIRELVRDCESWLLPVVDYLEANYDIKVVRVYTVFWRCMGVHGVYRCEATSREDACRKLIRGFDEVFVQKTELVAIEGEHRMRPAQSYTNG